MSFITFSYLALFCSDFRSDIVMKLVSLMGVDQEARVDKVSDTTFLNELPVSFEYHSQTDNDGVSVFAVIDPLSKNAHRVSSLLLVRFSLSLSLFLILAIYLLVVLNAKAQNLPLTLCTVTARSL